MPGRTTTVQWSQGSQNFIIVDTSGNPAAAQVRYSNQLACNGFGYASTLQANGFVWVSTTGGVTPYLTVQRASIGPFFESKYFGEGVGIERIYTSPDYGDEGVPGVDLTLDVLFGSAEVRGGR